MEHVARKRKLVIDHAMGHRLRRRWMGTPADQNVALGEIRLHQGVVLLRQVGVPRGLRRGNDELLDVVDPLQLGVMSKHLLPSQHCAISPAHLGT